MITLIVDHEDWDTVRVSTQSEVKEGDLDDGKDQLEQDEAGVPPHLQQILHHLCLQSAP